MKRALLIAGGTVGGLGAVLSITPPQLGSSGISTLAGASADTSAQNSAPAASATPSTSPSITASKAATNTSTKKATATKQSSASKNTNSNSTSNNSNSNSTTNSDNTAVAAPAPAPAGVTGSFTGDVFNAWDYGRVQVKITVSNGKITEAIAIQSPSGRSQRFSDFAIPNLRQQTLSAQSAAISGVGGASYTSYAWYKSLISALQKAGMPTGV